MIGLSDAVIEIIDAPGMGRKPTHCMRDVFGKWMENCNALPNKDRCPLTWDGLCHILEDSDSATPLEKLREALNAEKSTIRGNYY